MTESLLIATYELHRVTLLNTFLSHPQNVPQALAYAYQHRMAPFYHWDRQREIYQSDPYEEVYAIKYEFIERIVDHIDNLWRSKNFKDLEFYKLENKFGNRMELKSVIEYAKLDGRFDDQVYQAITSNAPMEANRLIDEFKASDVGLD